MSPIRLLVLTLCAMPAVVLAASPYRANAPATLTPPPSPVVKNPSALPAFAAGYAAVKRPRIAIFWNREFGDQLATQFEDYVRETRTDQRLQTDNQDSTQVEHGASSMTERNDTGTMQHERATGTRALPVKGARAGAAESVTWRLESAFLYPFLNAGVQLIDRNVTMRMLAGAEPPGSRPDALRVEASALAGKADLLMEVLMTPDADSPIGCRFRVTVRDVQSGAIVALLSTRALPQVESTSQWTSVAGGFRRVTNTRTPVLEEFAERLAEETMFQLAGRWGGGNGA